MKELSIEEKAKAFDEAIKYAQYLMNERCKEGTDGSFHRADLDKMFPELAETDEFITIPTLQMAIKWLREVYNIHIDINTNWAFKDDNFIVVGYMFDTHSAINSWHQDLVNYPTYEQAVEAALKYCLENLI